MSFENNIERRLVLDDEDLPVIEFSYGHGIGEALAYISPQTSRLNIDTIKVHHRARNQGIGKAILRSIKNLAHETDIHIVTATIISRESIDSMTSVFGEDAVVIRKRGEYGFAESGEHLQAIQPASARLRYDVNRFHLE